MTDARAPANPDHLARETLRLLGPAPENWVPVHAGIDHDVAIIGGGQSGTAYAFALRRAGIARSTVIDAAPAGPQGSAWRARARMHKLRTIKELVGPELGLPTLSFRAWFEARQGTEAYAAIDRIPRSAWADYLDWLRQLLQVPVRWQTRLQHITPITHAAVPHFRLTLLDHGVPRIETARKLVLATGVAGGGAPFVPPVLQPALDAGLAAHTASTIDFGALRGKTVAVIGAAASAFDAAGAALEAGAAAVHLFARRDHIAATPVGRTRGYPGVYDNYHALPDALRWEQALRFRRAGSTPPADALQRVLPFEQFHLHLSAPWEAAQIAEGRVQARAAGRNWTFDFVIAGTGYQVEPLLRPELADIAPRVLRWRDRYTPPAGARDAELGASPYLGAGLQLQEKHPGSAPWLADIHLHNPAGFASTGVPLGDVPCMRRDIPAAVARISHDLLQADLAHHAQRMRAEVPPDYGPELYAAALHRPGVPADATAS